RPACPSRASGWSSCPRLGVSRVAYAFLVYLVTALPPASGWAYCFAHSLQPYQPSPKGLSGRPAHRPFRGLLGVYSRYGLHTRAVTVYRDTLTRGFSHFVTSMTAPVASGWSDCRVGLTPTGKRRLFTAHTRSGPRQGFRSNGRAQVYNATAGKPKMVSGSKENVNGGAKPGHWGGVKPGQFGHGGGRSRSALFNSAVASERPGGFGF